MYSLLLFCIVFSPDNLYALLSKNTLSLVIGDDRDWAPENNPLFDELGKCQQNCLIY